MSDEPTTIAYIIVTALLVWMAVLVFGLGTVLAFSVGAAIGYVLGKALHRAVERKSQ